MLSSVSTSEVLSFSLNKSGLGASSFNERSAAVREVVARLRGLLASVDSLVEASSLSPKESRELAGTLQRLRSCCTESSKIILSDALVNLAKGLVDHPRLGVLGERLLVLVEGSELPGAALAARCLKLARGEGGSLSDYAAQTLRRMARPESYASMAVALAGASLAGKAIRLAAGAYLRGGSLASVGGSLAVQGASSMIAVAGEAAVFPFTHHVGMALTGQRMSFANYGPEALHGLKLMGTLNVVGFVSRNAHRALHGVKGLSGAATRARTWAPYTKTVLHGGGELAALTGLSYAEHGGDTLYHLFESAGLMFHLRGARSLGHTLLPGLHHLHQKLDLQNYLSLRSSTLRGVSQIKNAAGGFGNLMMQGRTLAWEGLPSRGILGNKAAELQLDKMFSWKTRLPRWLGGAGKQAKPVKTLKVLAEGGQSLASKVSPYRSMGIPLEQGLLDLTKTLNSIPRGSQPAIKALEVVAEGLKSLSVEDPSFERGILSIFLAAGAFPNPPGFRSKTIAQSAERIRQFRCVALRSLIDILDGRDIPTTLHKKIQTALAEFEFKAARDLAREFVILFTTRDPDEVRQVPEHWDVLREEDPNSPRIVSVDKNYELRGLFLSLANMADFNLKLGNPFSRVLVGGDLLVMMHELRTWRSHLRTTSGIRDSLVHLFKIFPTLMAAPLRVRSRFVARRQFAKTEKTNAQLALEGSQAPGLPKALNAPSVEEGPSDS